MTGKLEGHEWIEVGTVHRDVTARGPAVAHPQQGRVFHLPDIKFPGANARSGNLCMALQAKIIVPFNQHLGIDRAVRLMADSASFAQCFVFENERASLLAMALSAPFIQTSHHQSPAPLVNIHSVRIVTLGAIHFAFPDRVMLRQINFGMSLQMALQAGGRVVTRINDQPTAPPACRHMPAARTMACLAAGRPREAGPFKVHSSMGTGREYAGNVGVTLRTNFVANEGSSRNGRWRDDSALHGRTGNQQNSACRRPKEH
jgi:hypothetical protein